MLAKKRNVASKAVNTSC